MASTQTYNNIKYTARLQNGGSYRSSGSYGQGGARLSQQTIEQTYHVHAEPLGTEEPHDTNEHIVGCLYNLLPVTMKSVYYDSDSGLVNPYALCTSKSINRNKDNPWLFEAKCTFQTKSLETENCTVQGSTLATPTDVSPEVTVSVGSTSRVLYQDLDTGEQSFMYPEIDVRYTNPVQTDVPNLTLTINQYEVAVSYAQILERSYVTNSSAYGGFAAGMWRCIVKNVSDVDVQVSETTTFNWARVTYEVSLSQDGYYDNGSFVNSGWAHQVPLIAPKYKDGSGDVVPFLHPSGEPKMGFITSSGTEKTGANNFPDYILHRKYRTANFSSFLQA